MNAVVREYFRQRRLTGDTPVVCWHVALINVIGSDAAWDMVDAIENHSH